MGSGGNDACAQGGNTWLIVKSRRSHTALFHAALWQNCRMMPNRQRIRFRLKSDPDKVLKKEDHCR